MVAYSTPHSFPLVFPRPNTNAICCPLTLNRSLFNLTGRLTLGAFPAQIVRRHACN
jgi:hypothetical protein